MNVLRESPRLAAAVAAAVLVVLVLLGVLLFGGSEQEATDQINRAFDTPVQSGDISLDAGLELNGVPQLEQPIRIQVRGPYRSGDNRSIPSLDLAINFSGAGQNFQGGVVSTGRNAWVELLGQAYEVGEQQVAAANQQIAAAAGQQQDRSLRDFGVDPNRWLDNPSVEGDEEIAGTETTHISSGIDVGRLLEDLNTLGQRAGGQVAGAAPRQLSAEQRERVERIVQDPEFDIYVDDQNRVRRLSTVLDLEVPEEDRQAAGGAESGRVTFSIEFANVGRPGAITPPTQARPIEELTQQLLQLFGGAAGAGGAGGAGAVPGAPGGVPAQP